MAQLSSPLVFLDRGAGRWRHASEVLNVSQPSISAQLSTLEKTVGEPLFRRTGRSKSLTETGQLVYSYAEEIFAVGRELQNALSGGLASRVPRLDVGIADTFPKLVTQFLLRPVTNQNKTPVRIVCREGKLPDLLGQLAMHRLDAVLSDEPAPGHLKLKTFNHFLGDSGISFCAAGKLGASLRRRFPESLHDSPALLPTENTALRRTLELWFQNHGIRPRILGEFEDRALMKIMATDGQGFTVVPTIIDQEAQSRYRLRVIGRTSECRDAFYVITAERKISNPLVTTLTESAKASLANARKSRNV